jgi:hypothetical protein
VVELNAGRYAHSQRPRGLAHIYSGENHHRRPGR